MAAIAVVWDWPLTAAALLSGFYGLLRPGEIAGLRRGHLRLPSDGAGLVNSPTLIIALVRPKTRHRAARLQSVVVRNAIAITAVHSAVNLLPRRCLLVPDGVAGFAKRFAQLLNALNINLNLYTPASLRGGGCVSLFQTQGVGLTDIMFAGRWESTRTVSIYLQEGLAAFATSTLSAKSRHLCLELSTELPAMLNQS